MTDAGFFKGTTADQDTRFTDKKKKLMKSMKFSELLDKKIDMSKVNLDTIKPWISERVTDLFGLEDDVIVEYVYNQLEAGISFANCQRLGALLSTGKRRHR